MVSTSRRQNSQINNPCWVIPVSSQLDKRHKHYECGTVLLIDSQIFRPLAAGGVYAIGYETVLVFFSDVGWVGNLMLWKEHMET